QCSIILIHSFFPLYSHPLDLHSFPTRRSSDLTHHHMTGLSIPMVDTVFLKREDVTDQPPMPYPFVLKESAGRSGKQVYLIESQQDWNYYKSHLSMEDIIIQNCAVQLGKDLRVFIVGQEIIGAV